MKTSTVLKRLKEMLKRDGTLDGVEVEIVPRADDVEFEFLKYKLITIAPGTGLLEPTISDQNNEYKTVIVCCYYIYPASMEDVTLEVEDFKDKVVAAINSKSLEGAADDTQVTEIGDNDRIDFRDEEDSLYYAVRSVIPLMTIRFNN